MSKQTSKGKARRDRKPNVPMQTGPVASAESAAVSGTAAPIAAPAGKSSSSRSATPAAVPAGPVDYRAEYSYVGKDLKQMGLVALGLLVVLVALSFVIV